MQMLHRAKNSTEIAAEENWAPVATRRPSKRRIYKENQCRYFEKQFKDRVRVNFGTEEKLRANPGIVKVTNRERNGHKKAHEDTKSETLLGLLCFFVAVFPLGFGL